MKKEENQQKMGVKWEEPQGGSIEHEITSEGTTRLDQTRRNLKVIHQQKNGLARTHTVSSFVLINKSWLHRCAFMLLMVSLMMGREMGGGGEGKRAALVEEAPHRGRHPSTTPSAFWHRRSPPISGGRRANNSEERAKKTNGIPIWDRVTSHFRLLLVLTSRWKNSKWILKRFNEKVHKEIARWR